MTNLFHYFRMTEDGRILWGGYDAVYDFAGRVAPERDERPATFDRLAEHFFTAFPQLEGIGFSHRWGGAIDTCSRFSPLWGRALGGRAVYVVGFTGLGVGSSRFGARVALDLLDGADNERTRLEMVRRAAAAVPAGAGALGGHPADAAGAGARRRARGPARPVAARARPARARVRLLISRPRARPGRPPRTRRRAARR